MMADKIQSINRGWLGPLFTATFLILSAVSFYEFRIHTAAYGLDKRVKDVVDALQYLERPDITIRTHYTGIATLDYGLRFLVTVFLPSVAPFSEHYQVQLWNFLLAFFPFIVIISVEATRNGAKGSLIRYPSFWALLYQTVGGAIIIPIWLLLFSRPSMQSWCKDPAMARLPLGYAKALMTAHVVGYLIPTLVLFLPFSDPGFSITLVLIANWQPSPLYVSILLVGLAQVFDNTGSANKGSKSPESDLQYIKTMYAFSSFVAAVSHITLLCRWTQAQWSLVEIFIPRQSSLQGPVPELLYYIFQMDYFNIFAAALVAALVVMLDLRQLGRSQVNPLMAGISLILGTVLVGPGATMAAVWWWREDKLRSRMKSESSKGL